MAETELNNDFEEEQPRGLHLDWVFPLFFRPRKTLEKITSQERGAWLAPLLIISLLAIVLVVVSGPVRAIEAQMGIEPPPDFQYWAPEQQEQFYANQAGRSGPLFIYVFPAVGALLGVWLTWFLLGSVLHLTLTLVGSRGTNTAALNLVSWASLPIAVRLIVQIIAILATRQLIDSPGLSGFISADAAGFMAFLRGLLSRIDLYLIWQVVLMILGVGPMTGLARGKAGIAVVIAVLIVLSLAAVPGLIAGSLGDLSSARFFF